MKRTAYSRTWEIRGGKHFEIELYKEIRKREGKTLGYFRNI